MATKRKPAPVRTKAARPKKKTQVPVARKAARGPAAGAGETSASRPPVKRPAVPAGKSPKSQPTGKSFTRPFAAAPSRPGAPAATKPAAASKFAGKPKAGSPVPGRGAKPVLKVKAPPAPVRPIGALGPEAVARAVKSVPPVPRKATPPPRPQQRVTKPSKQGVQGVSEKDFKEFEQRLLTERAKILKEMGHLENTLLKVNQRDSAGDLSGYSFHMADVGTDAMEREKAFMFASTEGHLLQEIDHALRKVYSGEYGACENCGSAIGRARLEAMPYARLCLSCKEQEERSGRGA